MRTFEIKPEERDGRVYVYLSWRDCGKCTARKSLEKLDYSEFRPDGFGFIRVAGTKLGATQAKGYYSQEVCFLRGAQAPGTVCEFIFEN